MQDPVLPVDLHWHGHVVGREADRGEATVHDVSQRRVGPGPSDVTCDGAQQPGAGDTRMQRSSLGDRRGIGDAALPRVDQQRPQALR